MADTGLYLVKLQFKTNTVGAGSMVFQCTVNATNGALNGVATGNILEGTADSPSFTAKASGHLHGAGYGPITKLGAVSGEAAVTYLPTTPLTIEKPFTASFAVDDQWHGTGRFSVGDYHYDCDVSMVD